MLNEMLMIGYPRFVIPWFIMAIQHNSCQNVKHMITSNYVCLVSNIEILDGNLKVRMVVFLYEIKTNSHNHAQEKILNWNIMKEKNLDKPWVASEEKTPNEMGDAQSSWRGNVIRD